MWTVVVYLSVQQSEAADSATVLGWTGVGMVALGTPVGVALAPHRELTGLTALSLGMAQIGFPLAAGGAWRVGRLGDRHRAGDLAASLVVGTWATWLGGGIAALATEDPTFFQVPLVVTSLTVLPVSTGFAIAQLLKSGRSIEVRAARRAARRDAVRHR